MLEAAGFSVVREYCGHGIGKVYHDEPQVLHYGRPSTGLELKQGMTFTVEPMINAGKPQTQAAAGWLDGGHQGSFAVGAVGAHHRGHRRRVRDSDALAGRAVS